MYPTRTTSTTGTFRIPALRPAPAHPAGATAYASGPVSPPVRAAHRAGPEPVAASRVPAPEPLAPAPARPEAPEAHPAKPRVAQARPAGATRSGSGAVAAHPAGPQPGGAVGHTPAPRDAEPPGPPSHRAHPAAPASGPGHPTTPPPAQVAVSAYAGRSAASDPAPYGSGHPALPEPASGPAPARPAQTGTPQPPPVSTHPADAGAARAAVPHPAPSRSAPPAAPEPAGAAVPPHPADADPHPAAVAARAGVPDPAPAPAAHPPAPEPVRAGHPAPSDPARPGPPHPAAPVPPGRPRGDVPAARGGAAGGIPHPTPEPAHGVPGPGPAEIAAQAVARGMRAEAPPATPRPPRGTAVTELPLHLPFRPRPQPPASPAAPPAARPAPKPPAGRRVPRGDDRLREHRGPVLPGWIAVAVGGLALAGCAAVLWRAGVVPATVAAAFGASPRAYRGLRATHWPPLAFLGVVTLLALGGLGRAKAGHAWVLTLFGRYRGTVRRTGLTWISPLLLRRRVDVRLRHWRSEPMPAVDSGGLALQVVVQVVWQVKDTARATLAVEDHTGYLAEQVESAMARVLSQLPADAFHEDAPTLRDAEAVGDALTRMLAAETEAVGIEVFSAQPIRIEYAPEVAEAMRRRRVAAIDAKHRDAVLTSVVDAVDDTVHRLTSRGIVELDDYERKALVKDLTVAFYTGRSDQ
ncbi:SPFH domain-containing protein [Streptomyces sp. NPDC048352]|uniref:SPFH domain-containing protein n=1 Tax=Streptomyces sp. NPDC048352 TaxID=3154718 RepID=UPI003436EECC